MFGGNPNANTQEKCNEILKTCCNKINTLKIDQKSWDFNDRNYVSFQLEKKNENVFIENKYKAFFEENLPYEIGKFPTIYYHIFDKGSFFSKHNDKMHSRVFGIGTILNDDYEGGDLIMWEDTSFKFKTGDIMIFPSSFLYPHMVSDVIKGDRFTMVSWVH